MRVQIEKSSIIAKLIDLSGRIIVIVNLLVLMALIFFGKVNYHPIFTPLFVDTFNKYPTLLFVCLGGTLIGYILEWIAKAYDWLDRGGI